MQYSFKGPRLVDVVLKLIEAHGLSGGQVGLRYGVEESWLSQLKGGRIVSPRADICQAIYEDLAGRPLIKLD